MPESDQIPLLALIRINYMYFLFIYRMRGWKHWMVPVVQCVKVLTQLVERGTRNIG